MSFVTILIILLIFFFFLFVAAIGIGVLFYAVSESYSDIVGDLIDGIGKAIKKIFKTE